MTRSPASTRLVGVVGVVGLGRAGAVLGVLVAVLTAGLPGVGVTPTALAADCPQQPAGGTALPRNAGRDPVIGRLGLERSWELSTGKGVTVAVVDSGVDARAGKIAPALTSGVVLDPTRDKRVFQQSPGGTEDCDNHGTPIAGLIAARAGKDDRVMGVAPNARIAPVRIGVPIDQAPDVMIAAAIRAGADRGSVLNLSFALPVDRPAIRDAVRYAISRNVVVVAAAGNENGTEAGRTWYPAAYPGVLAVAAVTDDGKPLRESNRGPWVGIAAPGASLTAPSAVKGYVTVSGTSFATALVSGTAALVRARFPTMSAKDVVERLRDTAVPVTGGNDERVGAGVVDPFAALTASSVGVKPAAPSPGAVRVAPRPVDDGGLAERWGRLFTWAGVLGLAALLAFLGRLAVRAAIRRRWQPGHLPTDSATLPQPHPPSDVTLT